MNLLAIDQGTTSTRAMVFDGEGRVLGRAQTELTQRFPGPGLVEHDTEEIWRDTVKVMDGAVADAGIAMADVAAIGITNQRETTILWDRATGEPVHPAIVWQDRRTAPICERLVADGLSDLVRARTGLVVDPYFSGTKIAWLLEHVDGLRARAEAGEIAFGTVDSFLVWRLTGGRVHATDASNASRTLLFDIHRQDWDDDLLGAFGVPRAILPEVRDSAGDFGATDAGVPIAGVAGDQQAALVGQACLAPGATKSTFGTGCFVVVNTGDVAVPSASGLLTTVAVRLGGRTTYALEGSAFVAGAAIQWLRDGLGLFESAEDTERLARAADPAERVVMVPAFVGLGAPHWDAHARGAIFGLTRSTGPAEITRAALESVCFQTRDLLDAMAADGAAAPEVLRVDGGMVANDWLLQALADLIGIPVERPAVTETTALGAAALAGIGVGVLPGPEAIPRMWRPDRRADPEMAGAERAERCAAWADAVRRVKTS
ncbi:MAG: glycerol kinase GlpK [Planctomycetota bacterium]